MSSRWGKARARLVGWLPTSLMAYPFEAFVAVYGLLAGALVVLTGAGVPDSVREALPALVIRLWGASLLVGALTVAIGMRRRWRLALPVGLRLVALSLGIFAVVAGWAEKSGESIPGLVLLLFIAALAAARSLYLRATAEVKHRVRTERGG